MIKKCECGNNPTIKKVGFEYTVYCEKCEKIVLPQSKMQTAVDIWNEFADKSIAPIKTTPSEQPTQSPFQHIQITENKFDLQANKAFYKVAAKVADLTEKTITQSIIEFAREQGYTDLFLIDENFVKSAIFHEMERRNNG